MMTLEAAAYWKLRAKVAQGVARHSEGQLRTEQAARAFADAEAITRAAFTEAGLELTPASRLLFDDEKLTITIGGGSDASNA